MTWDDECEAKARELMSGFVNDFGKPPREAQQAVANWLNQMMPYPDWRLEIFNSTKDYWVVNSKRFDFISLRDTDDLYYGSSRSEPASTLMEFLTQQELGL